jgi:NAD(P)H-flavin reductase
MLPSLYQVTRFTEELADTFTLELISTEHSRGMAFSPGQFNMLTVFGVGEVPISISGDPADQARLIHTIRAVGAVPRALQGLREGDTVGVRGPFGRPWPVAAAEGADVIVITGGIGLAPLRPAIYRLLAERGKYGNICIFYGARSPREMLYRQQLSAWRGRFDLTVEVTVDHAGSDWSGRVGVVTRLLERGGYEPDASVALVCGPELMMRFAVRELLHQGLQAQKIYLSMERNMKCALGFCGHCQLGPYFVCKDGPVFPYPDIAPLFDIREL